MGSLFRKEIVQFLGSITGYLAVIVFLVTSSLFLWVFSGNYNIPEAGYATLDSFFQLAPWLYLFLIPAITMRLFADEKRTGTIELLVTRPLPGMKIVFAKFLAGLVLVAFSLLPTLLYYFSVHRLGNPVGNIDAGGTWGAFTGLFLLASIYLAIGIFCSVITDNQIVAFILAMSLSFVFFLGFGFIAASGIPYIPEKIFTWFSSYEHYLSVSRGVIDLADILYFLFMTAFFLLLTGIFLGRSRQLSSGFRKWISVCGLALVMLVAASESMNIRLDLTAENRYSLSSVSKKIIRTLDEPVTIELFLDGELPPGFRKLKQSIVDKVKDVNRFSRVPVRLITTDPYSAVPADKRNDFFRDLAQKGIKQTELRRKTDKGTATSLIFPGALVSKGDKQKGISFLSNNPGVNHEVNLNHSVESVEYELISAFRKLMVTKKPELVFFQGHGELSPSEVEDLTSALRETFNIHFAGTGELSGFSEDPKIVVVAGPTQPFTEGEKLILDQLIMRGSRFLWFIDPVEVSLDSLSGGFMTLAFPRDLNLNDMLFRYGVRLNSDLVQDVACSRILVNTSLSTDRPDFTPQPWYYSPLLTPSDSHPVGKNLNLIMSEFVSSVDTVGENENIRSTVILHSSPYGRTVNTPAAVSLESINRPPARELFNRSSIPVGVLLEGKFASVFRNRVLDYLNLHADKIAGESLPSKMMVFSDRSLIANKVRTNPQGKTEILPLGFDRVSLQTFGNKELFVNAIHYLADEEGIMQLRNFSVKLRLLDKVRLREEGNFWKWFNTAFPVFFVLCFAVLFNFQRKRKFSKHKS